MKKLINKVDDVEREMIEGLAKAAPKKLRKLDEGNIIVRTPKKEGKGARGCFLALAIFSVLGGWPKEARGSRTWTAKRCKSGL